MAKNFTVDTINDFCYIQGNQSTTLTNGQYIDIVIPATFRGFFTMIWGNVANMNVRTARTYSLFVWTTTLDAQVIHSSNGPTSGSTNYTLSVPAQGTLRITSNESGYSVLCSATLMGNI